MATTYRHRKAKDFDIHEDDPATEDANMNTEVLAHGAAEEDEAYADHADQPEEDQEHAQEQELDEDEEAEAEAEGEAELSDEEELDDDMRNLQAAFNGFKQRYRLIKRIGEGLSTPRPGLVM